MRTALSMGMMTQKQSRRRIKWQFQSLQRSSGSTIPRTPAPVRGKQLRLACGISAQTGLKISEQKLTTKTRLACRNIETEYVQQRPPGATVYGLGLKTNRKKNVWSASGERRARATSASAPRGGMMSCCASGDGSIHAQRTPPPTLCGRRQLQRTIAQQGNAWMSISAT